MKATILGAAIALVFQVILIVIVTLIKKAIITRVYNKQKQSHKKNIDFPYYINCSYKSHIISTIVTIIIITAIISYLVIMLILLFFKSSFLPFVIFAGIFIIIYIVIIINYIRSIPKIKREVVFNETDVVIKTLFKTTKINKDEYKSIKFNHQMFIFTIKFQNYKLILNVPLKKLHEYDLLAREINNKYGKSNL